jgi:hypothetical protein
MAIADVNFFLINANYHKLFGQLTELSAAALDGGIHFFHDCIHKARH